MYGGRILDLDIVTAYGVQSNILVQVTIVMPIELSIVSCSTVLGGWEGSQEMMHTYLNQTLYDLSMSGIVVDVIAEDLECVVRWACTFGDNIDVGLVPSHA